MNKIILKLFEVVFLLCGSFISFRASGEALKSWFSIWLLSPYITQLLFTSFISCFYRKKYGYGTYYSSVVSSILILIFSILFYSNISSSTGCLVFLFGPFYLLFGGPIVFLIILQLLSMQKRFNV